MSVDPMTPTPTTSPPSGDTSGVGTGGVTDLRETARGVAGTVGEQAGSVARTAADHARNVVDAAGQQVQQQGTEQARRLADSLSGVSSELRGMADQSHGSGMVGDVTRSLAESTDRVASVLRDEGPQGVMRRASDFGREHPIQFLGLAVGAGFGLARVVRNSDTQRLQQAARSAVSEGSHGQSNGQSGNGAPVRSMSGGTSAGFGTDQAPVTAGGMAGTLAGNDADRGPG